MIVAVLAVLVAFAVADVKVIVFPRTDSLRHTDVVGVLSGNGERARTYLGRKIANSQGAKYLLLSVSTPSDPQQCWQHSSSTLKVICFRPDPFTTQGEARWITDETRKLGGHTITVVTSADQLSRARLRFSRCWNGGLVMAQAHAPLESVILQIPYQTAAVVKAEVLQRSC